MTLHLKSRWWHPMAKSVASTRFGTWMNRYTMPSLDRLVMRASGGKTNATALMAGLPVILLHTTGAKSGKARTTPLIALPDGRKLALIATNWGQKRNPAWVYNLRAHPDASVTYDGETYPVSARDATQKEHVKYWRWATRLYPGYENYLEWSDGRRIPIMVLTLQDESVTNRGEQA
jgi:deazaflavin-dependent oxidoreductase (nitroreductase family)